MKLEYFHNPVCPYCPAARELIASVLSHHDGIEYTEVDTFTEEGIKRGMSLSLMAVPAVAIDGVIKLTGWPFDAGDVEAAITEAEGKT
jgi:glutaredoxin